MRPFVLHAHFYQPERLNPWTGELDPEPTARPDRDWNERITRECYRPNSAARIFDAQRRVERIVNNYERTSFNIGPTLLGWMERTHPHTYARILDGDWRSAVRTGHGNALAQAYNHMILPLANERDRHTQIRWGLADFSHRFGRAAEGLWLPETGADQPTIDALIDARVAFTVLAPHQAARVREHGGDWREVHGGPDTSRPYRLLHSDGSGRSMAVFFYDGGLAQSLAFDPATGDAAVLLERIQSAGAGHGGLINAALDGETFGHHHPFGELGLAYALFEAAQRRGLQPTNYATYLASHRPAADVELVGGEGTAWSCAHGVGRWARDCGCSTSSQPGWNQAWRAPLRAALDAVRDFASACFAERGAALLGDPWAARDDYVQVKLGAWTPIEFLERHGQRNLSNAQKTDLWTLLESQRHAMVMYTSCGWFFADISGIETVYVMRSAARVLGLLRDSSPEADVDDVRDQVLDTLSEAKSNQPGQGTGADIWRREVTTAAVTPWRIAADLALQGLVRGPAAGDGPSLWAGHEVSIREQRNELSGRVGLTTTRLDLSSQLTGRNHQYAVAAVHLGGLDFYGVVGSYPGDEAFALAVDQLWQAFPTAPVARLIQLVGRVFEGREFGLEDALPQGRQQLVGMLFTELADHFRAQYARLYHDNRRVLEMLTTAGYELPRDLRAAAELTLSAELEGLLASLEAEASSDGDGKAFDAVREILSLARDHGYELDLGAVRRTLTAALTAATRRAAQDLDAADVDTVERWRSESEALGIALDLSIAQEHAYTAATKARTGRLTAAQAENAARLGDLLALSPVAWMPARRVV